MQIELKLDGDLSFAEAVLDGVADAVVVDFHGAGLEHDDAVGVGDDDEVEGRIFLKEGSVGIGDEVVAFNADADGADGAAEGDGGDGEGGGGAHDAKDVGVGVLVGGEDGVDDLDVVGHPLGK